MSETISSLVWDFLLDKTGNPFGTAAIMGNLMAESSMTPICVTGLKKTGISTPTQYVTKSDNGSHDFSNDGCAFGLAQWCYKTRKKGLLDYAKSTGRSVGHLQCQLEYLVKEMSENYKTVWKSVINSTDIRVTSDVIMLKYEKPSNTSETAKQKRAEYAYIYYNRFASSQEHQENTKKVIRTTADVNIRAGKGKNTAKLGVLKKGSVLEWLESENGWNKFAAWVSGDYSKVGD